MDHYERQEKKREAMRNLRAQRRRAGELRRRVVVTSLVAFVLLWAVVFAQMATGNDPVLSAKFSKAVATTSAHDQKARRTKVKARRSEATAAAAEEAEVEATETATGAEASEGEAAEAAGEANEAEAIQAEAEAAEVEAAEIAEAEAAEAEPEVEEFVEEPAPVTTSQS